MYILGWTKRKVLQNYRHFCISLVLLSFIPTEIQSISIPSRIRKSLAQHICKQTSEFTSSGTIQPEQQEEPEDLKGGECGWYYFGGCSGEECNLEGFKPCEEGDRAPNDDGGESTGVGGKEGRGIGRGKIVGGRDAKPHSFPSIVSVEIDGELKCGGTILNSEWVLSAAHCCVGDTYRFTAGEHIRSKQEGTEQVVTATKVIQHESYSKDTDENDIALFKVNPPFNFNDKVQPVKLPSSSAKLEKGVVTSVGWGVTYENGNAADVLQEVDLPIISYTDCKAKHPKYKIVESMMCTLQSGGGKDACQGDSGGPIYSQKGGEQTQVGVVSWGIGCARNEKPGVYTEVASYLDWIKKNSS